MFFCFVLKLKKKNRYDFQIYTYYKNQISSYCEKTLSTTDPCPFYNIEFNLAQIAAPYPNNVQVKMPAQLFSSLQFIDYFLVYVGQSDCGMFLV